MKDYDPTLTLRIPPALWQALEACRSSLGEDVTRSEAVRHILADWLRTHGFRESGLRPMGPATDAVHAMDQAISTDRTKARSAGTAKPRRGKRLASVKETGEEVQPEQWKRFETAAKKPKR